MNSVTSRFTAAAYRKKGSISYGEVNVIVVQRATDTAGAMSMATAFTDIRMWVNYQERKKKNTATLRRKQTKRCRELAYNIDEPRDSQTSNLINFTAEIHTV